MKDSILAILKGGGICYEPKVAIHKRRNYDWGKYNFLVTNNGDNKVELLTTKEFLAQIERFQDVKENEATVVLEFAYFQYKDNPYVLYKDGLLHLYKGGRELVLSKNQIEVIYTFKGINCKLVCNKLNPYILDKLGRITGVDGVGTIVYGCKGVGVNKDTSYSMLYVRSEKETFIMLERIKNSLRQKGVNFLISNTQVVIMSETDVFLKNFSEEVLLWDYWIDASRKYQFTSEME